MSLQEQILAAETALQVAEQNERDTANKLDDMCRLTSQCILDAQHAGRITLEKQKHLDTLQAMLAKTEKEPTVVEKKQRRRRPMSAALKARRKKEYGIAWRQQNPMYAHEVYLCNVGLKMKPTLNPITPAKAKALQEQIDARPPQSSDSSATRKVPLETVL